MDMKQVELTNNSVSSAAGKVENTQKYIYCVSGLGADARVFQKLEFQGYQPVHICWEEPEKQESIADYVKRLTEQITSEQPILIGLSFGGIVAIEIAKQIATEKVILISSTKNQKEVPTYFQIFRWLPIHRLFPAKFLLWLGQLFATWFFSLETQDECQLLKAILSDTNANFMKWAIDQVINWKNELIPSNLFHIHGESDRIFPFSFVHEDFSVAKGGHFMIMNRAEYISNLIQNIVDLDSDKTSDGEK